MFRQPKLVPKAWGGEIWLHNSPMYCGKLLEVEEGKWCSRHYHVRKHETFYVLQGRIIIELEGVEHVMEPGRVLDIQPYTWHRFTSVKGRSIILEVSTQHLEEDSIREQTQAQPR